MQTRLSTFAKNTKKRNRRRKQRRKKKKKKKKIKKGHFHNEYLVVSVKDTRDRYLGREFLQKSELSVFS